MGIKIGNNNGRKTPVVNSALKESMCPKLLSYSIGYKFLANSIYLYHYFYSKSSFRFKDV